MKFPLLRAAFGILIAAGITIQSSHSEPRCPAGVTSLHARLVAGALLVIPVNVNQSGPYDFMVDTGSQLNVIDPTLAAHLNLKSQGTVGLVAAAAYSEASVGVWDSLEVGSQVVLTPLVVVRDLVPIQAADPRIRGVLGENFLSHFDVLIDYRKGLVCLDGTDAMQGALRGERIQLASPKDAQDELPFTGRLVISVNLSDTGTREILLQLDSGSDGSILYSRDRKLEQILRKARRQESDVSNLRKAFAVLPPHDVRLGTRIMRRVSFATPVQGSANVPEHEEDGILATVLFESVYINHRDHFVIFNPR